MKALFHSGYLFLALLLLTPMSFFISRNYTQQTMAGNLLSLAAALLMGLAGGALCAAVLRLLGRFTRLSGKAEKNTRLAVFAVVSVLVFPFFIFLTMDGKSIPGMAVFAALCVFLLIRIIGFAGLNAFLAAFTLLSLINIGRAEISEREGLPEPPAALPRDFRLWRRSNIYYFFLESMHDRATIQTQYDFDMPEFFAGLEEKRFTRYGGFIANYVGTLQSALAVFSMRHHYNAYDMNLVDTTRSGFAVLAENNVFRILKNNGYSINLFDINDKYVFRRDSGFIDYAHFKREQELIPGVIEFLGVFNPCIAGFMDDSVQKTAINESRVLWSIFSEEYPGRFDLKSPSFFYIHLGAAHIGEYKKFYPEPGMPGWKEEYKEHYRDAACLLDSFIARVLENDPDALIILNGDHGAWKYGREVELDNNRDFLEGKSDINAFFRRNGVEPAAVGAALGEVLTAVRWPEGIAAPEMPPKGLSHVTLFPFIFHTLAGKHYDETLFEPNISMNLVNTDTQYMLFAKDGKLLSDWEILIQPNTR